MKIADLFVKIGVQGAQKTKEELGSTRKTLGETASSALWAKAAIVGVLYGLERLVTGSNQTGAALQSFANYTGLSAEALQRYAYAGKQAGASAEEVQGSIMGIQKAMAQLETTGQGPAGLWVVSRAVGGLDKTRMRDTFYMFEKLQEFAKNTKLPTAVANQALESFGLSPATIAAMRQNAFNPKALAQANIYSDKEAANLARMNAQWANLGAKVQKAIGHLNAKHGGQLIKDISMIADKVLLLTDRLVTLAERAKVFQLIGKSFEGWAVILGAINDKLSDTTNLIDPKTGKKGGDSDSGWVGRMFNDLLSGDLGAKFATIDNPDFMREKWRPPGASQAVAPASGAGTINQTQNFYGPAEPRAVGRAAKGGVEAAVGDAVWQSQKTRKN